MKNIIVSACALSVVAALFCGCGESKPEGAATDQKPSTPPGTASPVETTGSKQASTTPAPTSPAPSSPAAALVDKPTPAASPATSSPTDVVSQFVSAAKARGDNVLSSVAGDLTEKVKSLAQSAPGNDALQSQLTGSLKSLASGNDSVGLSTVYQAVQSATLTPTQLQIAKEVGNLASAYVVQKNFSSLDGAQGDVATIVNSLRQGQITPAIPAIQKVAQNAGLTATQKQLLASIADKYAPGVSKAAGALQQGLQSIPGLGGSGK